MNKLFLTLFFTASTMLASAQFTAMTTFSEGTDSPWNVTDMMGVGYQGNEKLMGDVTMDGEEKYEL